MGIIDDFIEQAAKEAASNQCQTGTPVPFAGMAAPQPSLRLVSLPIVGAIKLSIEKMHSYGWTPRHLYLTEDTYDILEESLELPHGVTPATILGLEIHVTDKLPPGDLWAVSDREISPGASAAYVEKRRALLG